jgi:hypothetical protein
MDGEFEKIRDLMSMLECNTTAAKEHVSEAKWMIRTADWHAAIQAHPLSQHDQVHIFLRTMAECISGTERNLFCALASRTTGPMEME